MNVKQDLFSYLPSEIIIDILSRLPAQSIISCKCVCKWLHDLIETREFAQFHLSKSKSVSGLAITVVPNHRRMPKTIQLSNGLHLSTITTFNFIDRHTFIEGSADGLLLLRTLEGKFREINELYLCNPITREYINLGYHTQPSGRVMNYGFGVSKISGQYKAVTICMACECYCKVCTIGTGCWRSIAPQPYFSYTNQRAIFANGNLHWFVRHKNDCTPLISCFDLETEVFTTFSLPPLRDKMCFNGKAVLAAAAEDSLCFCYCSDLITIWMMKEYRNEKSWTKEFVINEFLMINDVKFRFYYPVTVSKDGVILMTRDGSFPLYYSCKNRTVDMICNSRGRFSVSSIAHIPSFVSLKCLSKEEENILILDL